VSPRFDKLLVLDMDETLVYATGEPLPDRPADFVGPYHVYKRPHVDHFLKTCLDWFEVGVWTSASRAYAAWILRELLPDPDRLAFVWTNERCSQKFDHEHHKHYELKPLKKLKRKTFSRGKYSLSKLIVVDDTPTTFGANYGNGIRVAEYQGEADDVELLLLLKYLESIGDAHDVRTIEKRRWRSKARQMLDEA